MRDLKPQHRAIARYLALGISLEQICQEFGLNLQTWRRITSEPIFQEAQKAVEAELEERLIQDAVEDPALRKLKSLRNKAISRLETEIDSTDPTLGASASTRIKAAESILNRIGYHESKSSPDVSAQINLVISEEKLNQVLASAEKKSSEPPPKTFDIGELVPK